MIRYSDSAATDTSGVRYVSDSFGLPSKGSLRGTSYTSTIASTTTTGTAITIASGYRVSEIITPSTWTAATLAFQGSDDGTNYTDLYDQYGTKISITPVAGASSMIDPLVGLLLGAPKYLKIISSVTQASTVAVVIRTVSA